MPLNFGISCFSPAASVFNFAILPPLFTILVISVISQQLAIAYNYKIMLAMYTFIDQHRHLILLSMHIFTIIVNDHLSHYLAKISFDFKTTMFHPGNFLMKNMNSTNSLASSYRPWPKNTDLANYSYIAINTSRYLAI